MTVARGIHWQLVWFSCAAAVHGLSYLGVFESAAPTNRRLPAGLSELPGLVLSLFAAGWLIAGVVGLIVSLGARMGHAYARAFIGIMFGTWAGAYIYGWLWGGNASGWVGAGLYAFTGLAVVTPPVWTVTIRSKSGDA